MFWKSFSKILFSNYVYTYCYKNCVFEAIAYRIIFQDAQRFENASQQCCPAEHGYIGQADTALGGASTVTGLDLDTLAKKLNILCHVWLGFQPRGRKEPWIYYTGGLMGKFVFYNLLIKQHVSDHIGLLSSCVWPTIVK